MTPRESSDAQRDMWGNIRETARCTFDEGRAYRYHDGHVTHDCTTMRELVAVTKPERRAAGVRWDEDRG